VLEHLTKESVLVHRSYFSDSCKIFLFEPIIFQRILYKIKNIYHRLIKFDKVSILDHISAIFAL